jgi:hypothetical protein
MTLRVCSSRRVRLGCGSANCSGQPSGMQRRFRQVLRCLRWCNLGGSYTLSYRYVFICMKLSQLIFAMKVRLIAVHKGEVFFMVSISASDSSCKTLPHLCTSFCQYDFASHAEAGFFDGPCTETLPARRVFSLSDFPSVNYVHQRCSRWQTSSKSKSRVPSFSIEALPVRV